MTDILRAGLAELGLDPCRAELLASYARLVLERNKVMNLTAITAPDAFARLHLLDSAALLTVADFAGRRVVDVGTGAGFPGVPLRILRDDLDLTLLDSTAKRVRFLEEACQALSLAGVDCVCARAEDFAAERREAYDIAVSRAVASLNVLCELCLPLVKVGGAFLAMKSVESDTELEGAAHAIRALGGELRRVVDYAIPTSDARHRVVVIGKAAATPKSYPRAYAQIKKKPL